MSLDLFSDAQAIVRLTPLQAAMLAHTRLAGGGAYVGQMSFRLRGALDPDVAAAALQRLVDRHAALRTLFVTEGLQEPLQVVRAAARLPVVVADLSGCADAEGRIAEYLARDRVTPFDLTAPPLMRVMLFRLGGDRWHLVMTRHHLIMDGWSAVILFRELEDLIGGTADLPPVEPFHRFIDWLDGRDEAAARAYWGRTLGQMDEPTALFPNERLARGAVPGVLEEVIRPLQPALVELVAVAARVRGLTQPTLFAGAWALVASRYAGTDAAQFGLTVAGRPEDLPGMAGSVGLFADSVPVRIAVKDAQPVGGWLEGLQRDLAEAARHAHLGLADVKHGGGMAADRPLFSHILVLEAYGLRPEGSPVGLLSVESYRCIDQTNFALNIGVVQERGVHLAAVFDPARLERAAIERLLANFETAIRALVSGEGELLGSIEVIGAAERDRLRAFGRGADAPEAEVLPARLGASVARHGDRVAVAMAGREVTYEALWRQAGQVAAVLRGRGVGCDRLVGLCLKRSVEQVVAILGVVRAGGAFVPLDPDDPPVRRSAMASDAGLDLVLDAADIATMLSVADGDPPVPDLPGSAAAYALFTSGSTGRPKAALNSQGAIVNRLDWMQQAYPIGPGDRVLQKTASTFDVAVWEFLWPLLEGACLVLAGTDAHRDVAAIRDAVEAERITVLHLVPSVLRLFLALEGVERCGSLRHLIVSGEALDADLPGLVRGRLPGVALHNLYGPAEAAIDVTYQEMNELTPGETVPIGRPIRGAVLRVVDRAMRLAPWGAVGELAIGGLPGGRGYVRRADLTADRFVPDDDGVRVYRTGDLAAWDEAGRLMFLGRSDHQVKLRGQRIELGEIEAAVRAVPGVADAAVLIEGKGTPDAALIAFLAGSDPAEGEDALIDRVRAALRDSLPMAMTPVRWRVLGALPRLPSQKIDRAALGRLGGASPRRHVAPRDEEEELLAGLWGEVLGRTGIGVTDDFFELGGHSLLLMQLANLIQRDFGVTTELAELFDATTIERQLILILDKMLAAADPDLADRLRAEVGDGMEERGA